MFIDASVVVAILNREVGYEEYISRMENHAGAFLYSPLVRFEAVAAIARSRAGARRPTSAQFDSAGQVVRNFFKSLEAKEVTITSAVGDEALSAAGTFGKFVGHEADLNFGDCYSYACATAYKAKLIYKGDDFSKTDLA